MSSLPGSGLGGFIPSFEASGKLITGYSRNPADFALNRYVQIQPVDKPMGVYLNIVPDNAGRIVASGNEFAWPDGNDAPSGADNGQDYSWSQFLTDRFAPTFRLGQKFVRYSDWDVIAAHSAMAAQQAMSLRCLKVQNILTTTANYPAGHFNNATSLAGGKFDVSTSATQYIKKGLNNAFQVIQLATLGVVKPSQINIVMSPYTAFLIAASDEIVSYVKNNAYGLASMKGETPVNEAYGLPNKLYGYTVVVDETAIITTKRGTAASASYVIPNGTIEMTARVGALEVPYGAPTFSSVTLFELVNMQTEIKDDTDNKVTKGRVVEDYDVELTAGASSYLITAATA